MSLSRRSLIAAGFATAGLAALAGCSAGGSTTPTAANDRVGASLDDIIAKAKAEGKVQLIAYPEDWANYRGHFAEFKKKYGIETPVDNPEGSSAEELQAVKTLKGQPTQPDVLDIGYTFTGPAEKDKLIEAYKPSTFDDIPTDFKHPDGLWIAAYYGALSIGYDPAKADKPATFKDLLDPKYKGKVALPGDPRSGASSIATVFAASLANGGSLDDIQPGIDYFAELAGNGNLVAINSVTSALATGQAAVAFDWNYNFLGSMAELKTSGVNLEYFVPADGIYGNFYAQPVTIESPNPNAARLWVEWLNSDEGAEQYALGGAIPTRFTKLAADNKLSQEAMANLPDPQVLANIQIPTIEQGEAAARTINQQWASKVRY
ncbi:MAG: ABC transporter substrate-binding protein [Propionibacteriaceae bacterium]|nr:ABC transporter substrate-binding protein [Propionibacteriaceae bacterium]